MVYIKQTACICFNARMIQAHSSSNSLAIHSQNSLTCESRFSPFFTNTEPCFFPISRLPHRICTQHRDAMVPVARQYSCVRERHVFRAHSLTHRIVVRFFRPVSRLDFDMFTAKPAPSLYALLCIMPSRCFTRTWW